jgi:hypothetical protein
MKTLFALLLLACIATLTLVSQVMGVTSNNPIPSDDSSGMALKNSASVVEKVIGSSPRKTSNNLYQTNNRQPEITSVSNSTDLILNSCKYYRDSNGYIRFVGELYNKSNRPIGSVNVAISLINANGNVVAAGSSNSARLSIARANDVFPFDISIGKEPQSWSKRDIQIQGDTVNSLPQASDYIDLAPDSVSIQAPESTNEGYLAVGKIYNIGGAQTSSIHIAAIAYDTDWNVVDVGAADSMLNAVAPWEYSPFKVTFSNYKSEPAYVRVLAQGTTSNDATYGCEYTLGFKGLHDLIPGIVGNCKNNVLYNAVTGDGIQFTDNGMLVWHKADNVTAFTNGYQTWISSQYGLQTRLNTQRFTWEPDAAGFPSVPSQEIATETPSIPDPQVSPAPSAPPTQINPAPPTAAVPTNASLDIISITSPAARGSTATLSAKAPPGAQCTITVYYKSGPSQAQGLGPKQADANGNVSWSWKVSPNTTQGTWRVVVTATAADTTLTKEVPFEVR